VLAGYERITPQDVQAAARRYLTPDRAWMLVVRPEARSDQGASQ
jgi:predicted Zn-dependent peptidase